MTTWASWQSKTLPVSASYWHAANNGSRIVAVGRDTAYSIYSDDFGVTWIQGGNLPSSASWSPPVWDGTRFITVAYASTAAAYSTDGTAWVAATLPSVKNWLTLVVAGSRVTAIAYATGDSAYSTDHGATWSAGTTLNSAGAYASAKNSDGSIQVTVSMASATGMRSTNGFSTYASTTLLYKSGSVVFDAAHGRFVSISNDAANYGKTQYSTDGGTGWVLGGTLPNTSGPVYHQGLFYADGALYAWVDNTNTCAVSTNGGDTWTADATMPSSGYWRGASFLNGIMAKLAATTVAALRGQNAGSIVSTEAGDITEIQAGIPIEASIDPVENGDVTVAECWNLLPPEIQITSTGADVTAAIVSLANVSEPFSAMIRHKATGAPITGLTNVYLAVRNPSTGKRWDFAASAWSDAPASPLLALEEVDAANQPGLYRSLVITNGWTGWIESEVTYDDGAYIYSYPGEAHYIDGVRATGSWNISEVAQVNSIKYDTLKLTEIASDTSLARKLLTNDYVLDYGNGTITFLDDDNATVLLICHAYMDNGTAQPYDGTAAVHHTTKAATP